MASTKENPIPSGTAKRVDRFKQRGGDRPKLDPVAELPEFGYPGQRREAPEAQEAEHSQSGTFVPAAPSAAFQQFQLVSIDTIRPGPYQVRMVEDKAKDAQLRQQIQADLENHQTLRHVFVVVPDQEDSQFYNPKMGGHRRLKIAQALGVPEVYIWIEDGDQEELARGTYFENNHGARQDLSIVEEGELFRRVQERLGWTQTEIAERFFVVGGQPHVARCIQAASYPADLRGMLLEDPDRGMRAAHILVQVEVLGAEKAIAARAPLIAAFRAKKLTTDGLQIAVDRLWGNTARMGGMPVSPPVPLSVEHIQRLERATSAHKRFGQYLRELGDAAPSLDERAELQKLNQEIEAILARQ